MPLFHDPQVVLFCRDLAPALAFYQQLGFVETFRTPREGDPIHVDLVLDGYRLGLATEATTREDHGLDPVADGQRACVVLWTDDVDAAYAAAQQAGGRPMTPPAPWLGRLRIAWVEDPAGHVVQLAQPVAAS